MTEPELLDYVRTVREIGYKVVMTNGVFDLLHVGHVRFLQEARSHGHVLVVAVNDDDSTRRLKGSSRPINTLEDRMAVLEALKCVDAVVPFSDDKPARIILAVMPDVLVKGGDYSPDRISGADIVEAGGGKVLALDYHAGHSTTGLHERIAGPAAS